MTNTERAGKLLEARKIVLEVFATFNRKTHSCGECGLSKAEDWPEEQMARELEALAKKLDKSVNIAIDMDKPKKAKSPQCPE